MAKYREKAEVIGEEVGYKTWFPINWVYNKIIMLSNGLVFIASTITGSNKTRNLATFLYQAFRKRNS